MVKAIIESQVDGKGAAIELTDTDSDIITVVSRPTNDVQVNVLKRVVESHDAKLNTDAEQYLRKVVSAAAFKMELVKAGIIKDPGASGLKDLLG